MEKTLFMAGGTPYSLRRVSGARIQETDKAPVPGAGDKSKPPVKKRIPELEPGEPPAESSAGS